VKRKVDCCVNNVYLQDHVRLQLQRSDTILGNKSINSVTGKTKKEFLLVFCNFILKCAIFSGDGSAGCKSNYHTITTMTDPGFRADLQPAEPSPLKI
jgi:hypothetical protein